MNRATVRLEGDKTQKWERKGVKKKMKFSIRDLYCGAFIF